ncbi:periplasmic binding protein-like I [Obelidium mucronatum]|nr:periplasmic binding protein-like I [Obelidium mucronatum]
MDLTQYSPIASKQRTNITLGLVNWYCYIPGLQYDTAWATNYANAYDPAVINMNAMSGYVYMMDMAIAAAVAAVNNRSDILPYTTVRIRRFSDCGAWWPAVEAEFSGHTGGFATSEMAIGVGEKFADVVGVAGAEYSAVAKGTAEVFSKYQVPFCSLNSASPTLSDKNNFPYFFRMISSSGMGDYIALLYKDWNVKRMALVYQGDDLMSTGFALDIKKGMKRNGIEVITTIKLKGKLTQDMVEYAALMLKRTQSRYIYIAGQVDFVSKTYFSLALLDMVGKDYVYMGVNIPIRISTDTSKLSPKLKLLTKNVTRMAELGRGFIAFQSFSNFPVTPWLDIFYNHFIALTKFDNQTQLEQGLDSANNVINYWPVGGGFDCAMMLMMGFDKLLRENPKFTPEQLSSRALSKYLNYSQYLDLGYDGLVAQPVVMNSQGDLMMPFMASSYNGTVNPSMTNSQQNPFFMDTFAFTDLRATNITYYDGARPVFFDGSHTPPPDGPPIIIITPSINDLKSSNGKGIVALISVGLLFSVGTGAFFIKFQNIKAVKMASIPECLVIVFGSMLSYISLAFYVGSVTAASCKARIWLVLMGYILMMKPVIMKNVRLYIILNSKKRLDAAMLTMINRIVIAIGVLIEMALLVYWHVASTTTPKQLIADNFSFYVCRSVDAPGSVAINLLTAFTTIIHILLVVLAYMLKDVDPIYNESAPLATIFGKA